MPGLLGLSEDEARAIRHRLRVRLGALSTTSLDSNTLLYYSGFHLLFHYPFDSHDCREPRPR